MIKKKHIYTILAALVALATSCSEAMYENPVPVTTDDLTFVVGDFPAFNEGPDTRSSGIGTYDPGKTEWKDGDEILVEFVFATSMISQAQWITLTYNGQGWTASPNAYIDPGNGRYTAWYAPAYTVQKNDMVKKDASLPDGLNEHISITSGDFTGNRVTIDFSTATRAYNRIRIAMQPTDQQTFVKAKGFLAYGNEWEDNDVPITIDDNGNVYLYGTWDAGTRLTVSSGNKNKTWTLPDGKSQSGKAYVVDFR